MIVKRDVDAVIVGTVQLPNALGSTKSVPDSCQRRRSSSVDHDLISRGGNICANASPVSFSRLEISLSNFKFIHPKVCAFSLAAACG